MICETHALWGDEPTPEHPATYTAYLAEPAADLPDAKMPAMVVVPGGSFRIHGPREKEPAALEFLNRGFQVFVLGYVVSETGDVSFPNPEADLARMVATVRDRAEEWHVDPERVVACGFSAGGFICASLAAGWKEGPFAAASHAAPAKIRPDAVVLGYPLLDLRVKRDEQLKDPRIDLRVPKTGGKTGRDLLMEYLELVAGGPATEDVLRELAPVTHVGSGMPPVFVWGCADDRMCPVQQVHDFAAALARAGVPHEVHVFDHGGHGLSVANAALPCDEDHERRFAAVRPWVDLACAFLGRQGI